MSYGIQFNRNKRRYYGFWTEDGLILCLTNRVMSAEEYTDYTIRGKIMEMDSVAREVRQEIIDSFQAEYQMDDNEAALMVSPYIIDTTKNETMEIALTIAAYLALVAADLSAGNRRLQ